jgi:hypothetical protein
MRSASEFIKETAYQLGMVAIEDNQNNRDLIKKARGGSPQAEEMKGNHNPNKNNLK